MRALLTLLGILLLVSLAAAAGVDPDDAGADDAGLLAGLHHPASAVAWI